MCTAADADPQSRWRAAVPLLPIVAGQRFELYVVSCPAPEELKQLSQLEAVAAPPPRAQ